jgi:hypothetical protein
MRLRIASLLMFIWAAVQAYYLFLIGGFSPSRIIGWTLCLIAVLLALLLLTRNNWVRLIALIASIGMLAKYGWICFQYGVPPFSVAWLQPALALAILATLVKLPSNLSFKRDALKRAP